MGNIVMGGPRPFGVVGHRGATTNRDFERIMPENTLPAFHSAHRQGAAIELDVMTTRDGKVVVHHDFETGRIFRLLGKQKPIRQTSWEELKQARFNAKGHEPSMNRLLGGKVNYKSPDRFEKLTVPELETVLEELPEAKFSIELKSPSAFRPDPLERKVASLIREKNLYNQVTVLGFSPFSLWKIKQIDPQIHTALNFELPEIVKKSPFLMKGFVNLYAKKLVGVDALQPCYGDVTPALVELSHKAGLPITSWVNKETRAEEQAKMPQLIGMGVDGLITNSVDLLNETLQQGKLEIARPATKV